ncbi:MAG: hypothetical protein NC343_00705 [Muribaculum sp.]|nr:hypothetical protein [Muribaculaceae bacterium]MCM1080255.1 hypothetical protein [Muribaculum sp.]
MNPKFLHLSTLLLLSLLLAACQDNSGPRNHEFMYSDIVTIASASKANGTVFTMQRYDDSPLITYTEPNWVAPEEYIEQRVHLYYYTESDKPYTSGRITARSVIAINNGNVTTGNPDSPLWNADPIWLNSVWRTGNYLNFRIRLSVSPEKRHFALLVDETTLTDPQPQLYLVHNMNGVQQSYLSETYASFDISSVWERATCRSICVHISDLNLPTQAYTFAKP